MFSFALLSGLGGGRIPGESTSEYDWIAGRFDTAIYRRSRESQSQDHLARGARTGQGHEPTGGRRIAGAHGTCNNFIARRKLAKAEMEIRNRAAQDAEEGRKLTLLRYVAGEATALEVVSAQDTVSLERNALADAEIRYATAIANLSTLTGSL
ncbi:MAG TPA: TolC family protein [Acidobacteriaceae bacterium]